MNGGGRGLLDPVRSALLVIDVQERFAPAIEDFEQTAAGCARLAKTFGLLGLPVFATEQYPKGLGPTVEVVRAELAATPPAKTCFSSLGCDEVREGLETSGARSIVVCGIEAHVCVNQTVHDLLTAGYEVHVAADAVDSRSGLDRDAALRRMERAGAVLTTVETAAFELLRDARHPSFKDVQRLFL